MTGDSASDDDQSGARALAGRIAHACYSQRLGFAPLTREECAVAREAAVLAGFTVTRENGQRLALSDGTRSITLCAPDVPSDLARDIASVVLRVDAQWRAGEPLEEPALERLRRQLRGGSWVSALAASGGDTVVDAMTLMVRAAWESRTFGTPPTVDGPADVLATLLTDAAGYDPQSRVTVRHALLAIMRAPDLLKVAAAVDRPSRVTVPARPADTPATGERSA